MSIKQIRKNRMNEEGSYDVIHYETDAQITTYDNSNSGLIATTVQDAIDEIKTNSEIAINVPFTLLASNWADGVQTVEVNGMTSDKNGILSMSDNATDEMEEAIINAEFDFTQGEGTMIFTCNGTVPSIDIQLQVTIGTIVTDLEMNKGDMETSVYDPQGKMTDVFKYVDDSLADFSALPIVSASNNGAFLRVVDGAWAAMAVPSAEEASF